MENKKYKCSWPCCQFETAYRSKIDHHHVIPKSVDPSPRNKGTLPFCANHHRMIFHPQVTSGHHAIKVNGSLEIVQITDSTAGKAILYRTVTGREFWYFPKTGEVD